MKKLLLVTTMAMIVAGGSAYADKDMPATRAAAIEKYEDKVEKLKGMTDAEYAEWKKEKMSKKSSKKSAVKPVTGGTTAEGVGTEDEAADSAKHNATSN